MEDRALELPTVIWILLGFVVCAVLVHRFRRKLQADSPLEQRVAATDHQTTVVESASVSVGSAATISGHPYEHGGHASLESSPESLSLEQNENAAFEQRFHGPLNS